eukprot:PLAT15018.1.p1 GENE.PLAT15018.1~~PLAT15018.1.p1  ORF type:complete len:791 (+),score=357.06 PLAT15018.1:56-2428(+)
MPSATTPPVAPLRTSSSASAGAIPPLPAPRRPTFEAGVGRLPRHSSGRAPSITPMSSRAALGAPHRGGLGITSQSSVVGFSRSSGGSRIMAAKRPEWYDSPDSLAQHVRKGAWDLLAYPITRLLVVAVIIMDVMGFCLYSASNAWAAAAIDWIDLAAVLAYLLDSVLRFVAVGLPYFHHWLPVLSAIVQLLSLSLFISGAAQTVLLASVAWRTVTSAVRILRILLRTYDQGSRYIQPILHYEDMDVAVTAMTSPAERLIQIVQRLQRDMPLAPSDKADLARLATMTGRNMLFERRAFDNLDPDYQKWLEQEYGVRSTKRRTPSLSASHSSGEAIAPLSPSLAGDSAVMRAPDLRRARSKSVESMTPAVAKVLSKLHEYTVDMYELDRASGGHPLHVLCQCLFLDEIYAGIRSLRIVRSKLLKYVERVEDGYYDVPYHNKRHAAEVTYCTHYFLKTCGFYLCVNEFERFSLLLASIIHDFNHPGRNNAFLISSSDKLALLYNDRNILENMHVSNAWQLMHSSGKLNLLADASLPDRQMVREQVVELVLATDMKDHFAIMGDFKTKLAVGFDMESSEQRLMTMKICLKAADIGHPTKPLDYHLRWSNAITEEFFLQGDEEKALDLPVSALCDRSNTLLGKSNAGFLSFVVAPLFNAWAEYMDTPGVWLCLDYLETNYEHWKNVAETEMPGVQLMPLPEKPRPMPPLSPAGGSVGFAEDSKASDIEASISVIEMPPAAISTATVAAAGDSDSEASVSSPVRLRTSTLEGVAEEEEGTPPLTVLEAARAGDDAA